MMQPIAREKAEAAWDILVELAGARDDAMEKETFVRSVIDERHPTPEYRFMGTLGSGGKIYFSRYETPCVRCYPENETPARLETMRLVNERLLGLFGPAG